MINCHKSHCEVLCTIVTHLFNGCIKNSLVSFYEELCVFKIFCKLGHHSTLSADVIFSIHIFCKLYIQYNQCDTTVAEDGAAENSEVGRMGSFIFVISSPDFGRSLVSWCLFSEFLAWLPVSLRVDPLLGFSMKREVPVKERIKILSAEQRSSSGACLCLEERRNENQHGFCILLEYNFFPIYFFFT